MARMLRDHDRHAPARAGAHAYGVQLIIIMALNIRLISPASILYLHLLAYL